MAWKTVNAAQSTDARSQNAFRRFSNILMSHRNANGNIQYNPQDKSYRLVNDNGIFYSNGRFFSKSGIKGNYNVETGSILNKRGTRPSTPSKQQPSTKPKNAVPWKTAPVYSGVDIMTTKDTSYTPGTGQKIVHPAPFINQVQNQRTQKMVNSIGTNQLLKPETDTNKLNNQLVNLKFKQGGQMYKYAAGAQMVQPQQASGQQGIEQQAMALVQAAMQGDQQANQTIQKIMQAAQQGDQQAAQVAKLLQAIVQQMKGSRKARLGAKLDYIKQSIGECPEGQEVVYFKKGGEICKICAGKKMQDGGKSDPIKNFKKKKDVAKQTYQRNPYTRGKSAKEIAEMQRRNRQEASAGKGENDANVAPWNYKKKKMK